jgi:hypothetical protein
VQWRVRPDAARAGIACIAGSDLERERIRLPMAAHNHDRRNRSIALYLIAAHAL